MSTRRITRDSTSSFTIIYTRRRRYNRFLASFKIISLDIIKKTLSSINYRQSILIFIRRSTRKQILDDRLNALKRLEERRKVAN